MERRRGPWSFVFQPELGFLRYVSYEGVEAVRTVYVAVRDQHWSTLPMNLRRLEETSDLIEWESDAGDAFVWRGRIEIKDDGIIYDVQGAAKRNLSTNRTGLCVLHPILGFGGRPVEILHPDGRTTRSAFPDAILPTEPFTDIQAMTDLTTGIQVRFEGEVFETEDQRNWSDASYKTYCRPQRMPKPYQILEGEMVHHRAVITRTGNRVEWTPIPPAPPIDSKIDLGVAASVQGELTADEAARLKALGHIVVRFDFGVPDPEDYARRGLAVADATGLPIVALVYGRDAAAVKSWLRDRHPLEIRVADLGTNADIFRAVFPGIPILAASADNFTELNRSRPVGFDGCAFAVNPQVHAFDDISILESTESHIHLARSARVLADGPIGFGPVTFEPRGWASREPDSRFATLGTEYLRLSLQRLKGSGVRRATYFESHGPRGIFAGDGAIAERLLGAT